jgi:glycosyltransferase involved in cell wall biosynthesis
MKILHLFSDWKWTGPAEPVVNLCWALQKRGHEVVLAYRRPPFDSPESVEKGVKERDIKGIDSFRLTPISKPHQIHRLKILISDIKRISHYIHDEGFEIVNVHNSHDHIVGGIAVRMSKGHPLVIRMDHKRDSLSADFIGRWFFKRYTDGLITFSERGRNRLVKDLGFPSGNVAKVTTAVDLLRFDPRRVRKDMRTVFGISPSSPIVGIVARFQRYRKTEILLEAFSMLIKHITEAKLILVGRSSQMSESVIGPIERLGIGSHVVVAGYRMEDYVDTLGCMDIFVLLTPGSDGTARALREAMAMGKPVVVTKRGMLPELVQHGFHGFVVEENPEELCRALLKLVRDERLRRSMGEACYELARERFSLERQAEEIEGLYLRLAESRKES